MSSNDHYHDQEQISQPFGYTFDDSEPSTSAAAVQPAGQPLLNTQSSAQILGFLNNPEDFDIGFSDTFVNQDIYGTGLTDINEAWNSDPHSFQRQQSIAPSQTIRPAPAFAPVQPFSPVSPFDGRPPHGLSHPFNPPSGSFSNSSLVAPNFATSGPHFGHEAHPFAGRANSIPITTSDDVIGAASTLSGLNSFHTQQQHAYPTQQYPQGDYGFTNLSSVSGPAMTTASLSSNPAIITPPPSSFYQANIYTSSSADMNGTPAPVFSNNMPYTYGSATPNFDPYNYMNYQPPASSRNAAQPRLFRFGSDSNFDTSGYHAPPTHDEARVLDRLQQDMSAFIPTSANSTQPNSPVLRRGEMKQPVAVMQGAGRTADAERESEAEEAESATTTSRKRRKGKGKPKAEDFFPNPPAGMSDAITATPTAGAARKSSATAERAAKVRKTSRAAASAITAATTTTTTTPPKTKRASIPASSSATTAASASASAAAAPASKPARENLTEEQKRQNHILSEQKRRNLIRKGFEKLNELVPELRENCPSKSQVLDLTAGFLDRLIQGNGELRGVLGEQRQQPPERGEGDEVEER
ncbi:hypothetical protein W97_07162 [Coniosporium apollinis CBS 100218]|uniref:BHLH domain-containing protein n=1 Tax=Coniosporium apollinis (strain CBS 100218) TaxID=1168221 RepID=R7Z1E7_CONA1|nr:uncharacterized protein W97_07162 [Coniosporium apollinis CBS 100218]EON68015.1 hypothetical protein W97_07162 [Coniosporium apollinis CBS 100218]